MLLANNALKAIVFVSNDIYVVILIIDIIFVEKNTNKILFTVLDHIKQSWC